MLGDSSPFDIVADIVDDDDDSVEEEVSLLADKGRKRAWKLAVVL